jgi:hypothetical protein
MEIVAGSSLHRGFKMLVSLFAEKGLDVALIMDWQYWQHRSEFSAMRM